MQDTPYQQPSLSRVLKQFKPTFKLFIACEDQAAFSQARKVQSTVEATCCHEFRLSCALWNFALLRHERLRECAIMEAAEAQMIIISLRASTELPLHVRCWIENLPVRTPVGQAALVILLGSEKKTWATQHPHIAYFRQLAESRGLDFFCNQDTRDRLDFSNRAFRGGEFRMVDRSSTSHHIPWSTGGIND